MRIIVHREIPEDENLRRHWNELAQQMEHPEVFYTYEWALAVSRAYRASLPPLLLLGYDGGSLVGVAALATDRQTICFLTSTTADYCDFVCYPDLRGEFVHTVLAELQKMAAPRLVLANLPADSATVPALKQSGTGCRSFARPAYHCAQITLGSGQQREDLSRTVAGRKALRYSLRAMSREAPVSVDHLRTWDCIQPALPAFFAAHVARFQSTGHTSNLAQPERRRFLSELAELLAGEGWIVLSRLLVGERPVAWNYGFQYAGSWFYYQPTFEASLQRFSPGLCLLSKIVEQACDDEEIEMIDLGLGAEGYKERFANQTRQTLHVTVTTSALRSLKERARYYAVAGIKAVPHLEPPVRALVNRAHSLAKMLQAKDVATRPETGNSRIA